MKKLLLGILCIAVTLGGCGKLSSSAGETADVAQGEAAAEAYGQVLALYRRALEEKWTGQQLVDGELSLLLRDIPPETVGYTVTDLDGDGTQELIVGTLSGDAFYGKLIIGLYTLDARGQPVEVFGSMERDRFYYAGGAAFARVGSSGAGDSFDITVNLEGKTLAERNGVTAPEAYVQLPLTPIVGCGCTEECGIL